MNSIDKMKALMKEYFGITVPMLYYQDHEPIEYWYDSDKNSLCSWRIWETRLGEGSRNLKKGKAKYQRFIIFLRSFQIQIVYCSEKTDNRYE